MVRNYNVGDKHPNWKGGITASGESRRRYMRRLRDEGHAFVDSLKAKPCSDCGGTFPPYVMHFDHRDPKLKTEGISRMISCFRPRARILEEIAKCDVVCANCHSIRTYNQKQELKALLALTREGGRIANRKKYYSEL